MFNTLASFYIKKFTIKEGVEIRTGNPVATFLAKLLDPTQITSWEDIPPAMDNYKSNPNNINAIYLALSLTAAIPILGKVAKGAKTALAARNTALAAKLLEPVLPYISKNLNLVTKLGLTNETILKIQNQIKANIPTGFKNSLYPPIMGPLKGRTDLPWAMRNVNSVDELLDLQKTGVSLPGGNRKATQKYWSLDDTGTYNPVNGNLQIRARTEKILPNNPVKIDDIEVYDKLLNKWIPARQWKPQ